MFKRSFSWSFWLDRKRTTAFKCNIKNVLYITLFFPDCIRTKLYMYNQIVVLVLLLMFFILK